MAPTRTIEFIRVYMSVRTDHRIHRVARQVKLPFTDVLGRLVLLWMFAREQDSEFMTRDEADFALVDEDGVLGICSALVAHGLIDLVDEKSLRAHGIRDEIEEEVNRRMALIDKGAKSGQSRRLKSSLQNGRSDNLSSTSGQSQLDLSSTSGQPEVERANLSHQRSFLSGETRSEKIKDLGDLNKNVVSADSGAISEVDPQNGGDLTSKTQQSAGQEPFRGRRVGTSGLPSEALRLGRSIVDYITTATSGGKPPNRSERYNNDASLRNARHLNTLHVTRGIDWTDIEHMIAWVQDNPFWSATILSGHGLAKNWDRLYMQRLRSTTNGHANGSSNGHHPTTNRGRVEPMPPEAFGDGDVEL